MAEPDDPRFTAGIRAWLVRLLLIGLAFLALWGAQIADSRFRETIAAAFRFDLRQWSATITPLVIAGALFAVACRYPFPRTRYAWGRLILALVALVPAVHGGFIIWTPQFDVHWPTLLITPRWFDDGSVPAVCAVLAGVAIGSGFGARREKG